MELPPDSTGEGRGDQSYIDGLFGLAAPEQKARLLTEFFHEGIRMYLGAESSSMSDEIDRRISNCRPHRTHAHELIGIARDRGFLLEEHVPDGMADFLLIPDELLNAHGRFLLEQYMEWRAQDDSEALPHPSEYSGPRESEPELELQRLISDFAQLVKDWRDGLLSTLIEDLKGERKLPKATEA